LIIRIVSTYQINLLDNQQMTLYKWKMKYESIQDVTAIVRPDYLLGRRSAGQRKQTQHPGDIR
jgi:hypothetical protein